MNTRKERLQALMFLSPWIIGFTVFLFYPLMASVYYSFCDYSVLKPAVFIGLDNYHDLAKDVLFWTALKNTLIYAAMALPGTTLTALGLAMLLNSKIRGIAFYRLVFFIPTLVPAVATAVVWQFVLNGQHGILNEILLKFHIPGPNWLGDPVWSKPALVIMAMWAVGNSMVIYLAGLQDVPTQLYEAADLDGAKWWGKTWNVTLPMLSPVIFFNVIMGIIGTIQIFTIPFVVDNQGKPAHSIYFYAMYLYDNAFTYHKMGYACAMGWLMFVLIAALTYFATKVSEKHVHYSGG